MLNKTICDVKKYRHSCTILIEITTFAFAMQSVNPLNINLAQAAEAAKAINVELTDRFFADLEQEEISGGEVHVEIIVKRPIGDVYKVGIKAKGSVVVACDRCLDPLTLYVNVEDALKIKDADFEESDAVDMLYLEAGSPCYDLSWQVYEIIETSSPMQRVHFNRECNAEVTRYIISSSEDIDEDEITD